MGKCVDKGYIPYVEITVCDTCFHRGVCDTHDYLTENRCSDFVDKGLCVVLPCSIERIKDAVQSLHNANGCLFDDIGLPNEWGDCSKGCFHCVCDALTRKEAEVALGGDGNV